MIVGVVLAIVLGGVAVLALGADDDDVAAGPAPTDAVDTTTEPSPPSSAPMSDDALVETYAVAVWKVEVDGCGMTASGSAWAIDDHHLVTNAHVVRADPTPLLRSRSGRGVEATVVGLDDDLDIAVIEVGEELDHTLSWASTGALREGQRVLGLGYPVPGDFAATPGTIVSFLTEGGHRAAVRTDAALDFGNSGGPLLTEDGEVAGVVTLVTAEGIQAVPHAFTADHLRSSVNRMIGAPSAVAPDCRDEGEPAPEVEVPEYEAPPPPEVDVPEYTPPTTTTVPCPEGRPTITVDSTTPVQESPEYIPEWWSVTVAGTVRNDTGATIYLGTIDITLAGVPGTQMGFADAFELRPGEVSPFTADLYIESAGQPGGAIATMSGWSWSGYEYSGCGTG